MLRNFISLALSLIILTVFAPGANAVELGSAYLTGKWELNVHDQCGSKDAEYIDIRGNGTFEYGRRGKAESVGFWRVDGDTVMLEMLTSPAYFEDIAHELKAFHGLYGYYPVKAMTFSLQPDKFGAVASIGEQISKFTAHRCS